MKDSRVLILDEICGSGETISMVKKETEELGAEQVAKYTILTVEDHGSLHICLAKLSVFLLECA